MFCRNCGTKIDDKLKFCPNCGTMVRSEEIEGTVIERKYNRKFLYILLEALLLIVVGLGIIFLIKHNSADQTDQNVNSYEEVDKEIYILMSSEDYETASLDEKTSMIISELHEMEQNGKVLEDSICYIEDINTIWFKYGDGFENGVMLEEFTDGFSGKAEVDDYVVEWSEDIPRETNPKVEFQNADYPYMEKDVENLNLKAKYMFGLCDSNDVTSSYYKYLEFYQTNQTVWNEQYLQTEIDDFCTIDDFKTGLMGYNIVFIEEHGTYNSEKMPLICTREEFDNSKYGDDREHLATVILNGKKYWLIKPSFFEKYYGDNKLNNTIIWIGSCHGYQYDALTDAITSCGAEAVIGYDESVLTSYDSCLQEGFVYSLMYGSTVYEALEFSQTVWKSDDKSWYNALGENGKKWIDSVKLTLKKAAKAKIHPGGEDTILIKLSERKNDENRKIQLVIYMMESDEISKAIKNKSVKISVSNSDLNVVGNESVTDTEGIVMFEFNTNVPELVLNTDITLHVDGYEDYVISNYGMYVQGTQINEAEAFMKEVKGQEETVINKYEVFEINLTWEEAEEYCKNIGGHLATITSQEEQDEIYGLLSNGEYQAYWLGANVLGGEWKWITGEEFSYQNWDYGEPNRGEEGMCLQIYVSNGCWDDTWIDGDKGGGYKRHGFICEYEQ